MWLAALSASWAEDVNLDSLDVMIAFGKLPDNWREVLFDRTVLHRTLQDCANSQGVTRERIRQIEAKALKRFAELIEAERGQK